MKKLFVCALGVAALTFAACGNKTKQADCCDSTCVDSTAVAADPVAALSDALKNADAAKVEALLKQAGTTLESLGAEEKAQYAYKLQEFISNNKAKLEELNVNTLSVTSLVDAVKNLPQTATGLAGEAADAAKSDAQQVASETKAAVVEKATEKVEETKAAAVEKANEKVDEAAKAAGNKVNEGLNKAAGKLKL
ncbi:MAG: hypothetical protein PUG76_05050 [Prevotellaceae bacterium]|nr:hypothetical protein [Prevotellaceae bacterium]